MKKFFITGTDTGVGKTYITSHLLYAARQTHVAIRAFKPIASGKVNYGEQFISNDIALLYSAGGGQYALDHINRYQFEPAIAPHIAAKLEGRTIDINTIVSHIQSHQQDDELVLIEGIGGWQVPLNDWQMQADLVKQLDCSVLLVVAIKTGCINHALLTLQAIQQQDMAVCGWIANQVQNNTVCLQNIQAIEHWSGVPCLALIPDQENEGQSQASEIFTCNADTLQPFEGLLDKLLQFD